MDAAGVIAHYVMDGDQPLTAQSNSDTTYYLYGLGAIAEKTTAWSYSLPDGTNAPRQLTDLSAEITLSTRYTPWGDTLELHGTGSFTYGYFGGVMDAATGLLYVGNGQYYDPSTGRFLTRDAKPNNNNPYVPWDPTGAIIAPLGIAALFFGRKKKGSKFATFLVLLIVVGSVGMTLAACGSSAQATAVVTPTMTYVAVSTEATTVYTATPTATLPPSLTPDVLCPPIPTTGVAPANLGTETDFFTPVTDGKDAFLQAVLRHQNELPKGMTVKLLLAMGAAESGAANGWCQECLNGGGPLNSGVLQVDPGSGFKWKSGTPPYNWYNNSATGYDNNVRDAIAYLNDIASTIAAGNGREGVERIFGPLPSGDSIKLMLYYNGGKSNPIATYRAGGGNRYYLSQTAPFLINSPFGCSYDDPLLAADLTSGQEVLTHRIDHPEEP